ncbi:YtzI protein [Pseudalkalibacillus sp. SCS-8]|uniref:YtzI protein n=1 Tax=Pseudalkalibacillus nanhaiensis TaxID=3115291 RepID=UPI0032DB872D
MFKVMIASVLIIIFVLVIFTIAITKGYSYKHTIDPIENNPNLKGNDEDEEETN